MPRVPLRPLRALLLTFVLSAATARAESAPAPAAPAPSAPAAPAPAAAQFPATVTVGEKGAVIRSADGSWQVRLRALVQFDGRFFPYGTDPLLVDTFLIRRARPTIEGTVFRIIDFRLMPDFGGGTAVLYDAFGEVRPTSWLRFTAGKFKPPVGLERLQADATTVFVERAFPSNLAPQRDVGFMASSDLGAGALTLNAGVFNGVPDGGNGDVDFSESKDVEGRIFLRPFRLGGSETLRNVGFGVAGTGGRQAGSATSSNLPSYRSPGQQTFFSFTSESYAHGFRWLVAPQLGAWVGPFGLLAEYTLVSERVSRGASHAQLKNRAWQVAASWVLTGEKAGEDGVVPLHPLDPSGGGWGALELAARYEEMHVDQAAFPVFASPDKSARQARGIGVGLNWWATSDGRATLDYERTQYVGGAPGGGDRQAENAVLARLQFWF